MKDVCPVFVPPCLPTPARRLPADEGWLHEPKLDGWRIQVVKDVNRVALFTRQGNDLADRLPTLAEACRSLPARSCVIDGELVADEEDGIGDVWTVQKALGAEHTYPAAVMAFDFLHCNGRDLRRLPLVERKDQLGHLLERAGLSELSFVDGFAAGADLLAAVAAIGLEGVVSKRRDAPYRSGRTSSWLKVKCPAWIAANRERWQAFQRSR